MPGFQQAWTARLAAQLSCRAPSAAACWGCTRTFARALGRCSCSKCATRFRSAATVAAARLFGNVSETLGYRGNARVARQAGLELLRNMWRPPGLNVFK